MAKPPPDPLRTQLLEQLELLANRTAQLRDYATVPGNSWLAKSELQQISQLVSELETLLENIKQDDAENGY
jgi:hypothetical protein